MAENTETLAAAAFVYLYYCRSSPSLAIAIATRDKIDERGSNLKSVHLTRTTNFSPDVGTLPQQDHLMALVNRFMIGHFNHIAEWADHRCILTSLTFGCGRQRIFNCWPNGKHIRTRPGTRVHPSSRETRPRPRAHRPRSTRHCHRQRRAHLDASADKTQYSRIAASPQDHHID